MKKLLFLIILGGGMILFLPSCIKNCTCENPDTGVITDIEIDPAESCNAYSNAARGECS